MEPSWQQNRSKIDAKRPSNLSSIFSLIFDGFLMDLAFHLGCSEPNLGLAGQILIDFSGFLPISFFDSILVPTWLHFGSQNRPKSIKNPISKSIKKNDRFVHRVLIDFGPDFGHPHGPRRPQDGPKTAQDGPKTPPRRLKDASKTPKTAQDGSRMPKNVIECPRML